MLRDKMRWTYFGGMLEDEYRQCTDEGRDVTGFREELERVKAIPEEGRREEAARGLLLAMEETPVGHDCPYEEPTAYPELERLLPGSASRRWSVDAGSVRDKLKGAWYGRTAGCVLGIPVEGWPREKIAAYLKASGQWPLAAYMSASADPDLRARFDIHEEDPTTPYDRTKVCWRGCLEEFPNDDDLNYTVAALKVLERYGRDFTSEDVAETWLLGLPAFHACTAERAAIRNLMTGTLPPRSGSLLNPYREWIGAQIRGDLFGCVAPGAPKQAAELAWRDAVVSHTKNGVYGEMYIAALLSLCFVDALPMRERVALALEQIPPRSRLHQALEEVCAGYDGGGTFPALVDKVHRRYDETLQFDWCLTIPNAMLVTACILWHGDWSTAVTAAVLSGFDTDCNGATVGSILGLAGGFGGIAPKWYEGFPDIVNTSVHGYHRLSLPELVERTFRQIPEGLLR